MFEEENKDQPDIKKIIRLSNELVPKKHYSRFEIVLPTRSIISRKVDNSIEIEHPLFTLNTSVVFPDCSASIPESFYNLFLGYDRYTTRDIKYADYSFSIKISVNIKNRALFDRNYKCYCLWIDRYIKLVNDYASQELFFSRIGWERVETLLLCLKEKEDV